MPDIDVRPPDGQAVTDAADVIITYEIRDRFGADQHGDPNERHVTHIRGKVTLGYYTGDDDLHEIAAGAVSLSQIDLFGDAGEQLGEILDSASAEWTSYLALGDTLEDYSRLVIVDRAEIAPWARGHGLGLHVMARAIRSWTPDLSLVAMIAYPPGATGQHGTDGAEALARYWSQLGVHRFDGSDQQMLIADGDSAALEDTLTGLCRWP